MRHLAKDIPYRSTKVYHEQTRIHINEMLKEAGAIALRWTDTPDSMQEKGLPLLEFVLPMKWEDKEQNFGIRIQAPLIYDKKKLYGRGLVESANRNASMRLLYWYLKARLEAIKFKMEDAFEAFMPRIINSLPDGRDVTIGETIRYHPEVLQEMLPSFEIKVKALPIQECGDPE